MTLSSIRIALLASMTALVLLPGCRQQPQPSTAQSTEKTQAMSGAEVSSAPADPHADGIRPFGPIRFTDVTAQAGIHFRHNSGAFGKKYLPETMGSGVCVLDYDADGWQDIFFVNSKDWPGHGSGHSYPGLYHNNHDGTFSDVTPQAGLATEMYGLGCAIGDFDNDGHDDIYITALDGNRLFRNLGNGKFEDVTAKSGVRGAGFATGAVWFDYDNDGKLDLFLGGYYPEDVNLWKLKNTRMMPESFEYAENGGRKYLFHNLGNGKFEEVSEKMGIKSRRWALAAVAADLRGTGFPDLFVANDYGVSEMYFNDGGKKFREVGKETGVGAAPKSGMTASVGDILNQGQYAIFVSNISEEGVLVQGNNLWMARAGTSGNNVKFENMANSLGVELGGWSFGGQFGDLNNDGFLDLYTVNGNVSLDPDHSYLYDYSIVAFCNRTIISDAANWPPLKGRSLSGYQQKRIWINDGFGQFKEVSQVVGVTDRFDGRSIALADFFNNGALDAVVANQRGPLLLYKNEVSPANHWIEFQLEGRESNRSAIGAEVRLFWNGREQVQEVSGGSGFCSQNQRRLHFGIGKVASVDRVEIRWPSGRTQKIISPSINRIHRIQEPL